MNEDMMRRALSLAWKGYGKTGTNPPVGAVVVRDGQVIAEGYHRRQGGPHAEVEALGSTEENLKGAEMYVTLEPCCHYGKTPPCTDEIFRRGISKVFVSVLDPDPRVGGKGIQVLRERGVEVFVGLLKEEAEELYRDYFLTKKHHRPKIILKAAMSLDGKIATVDGESQWITNEASRLDGHRYRGCCDGILVGISTVLADDPLLTNRSGHGKMPLAVVLDTNLRIPIDSRLVKSAGERPVLVFTSSLDVEKKKRLKEFGVEVLTLEKKGRYLPLSEVLGALYDRGIGRLLVEGGATVHGSFVGEKLVDEVVFYVAPVLLGGRLAKSAVEGPGIGRLRDALTLQDVKVSNLEGDLKIEGKVLCSQD